MFKLKIWSADKAYELSLKKKKERHCFFLKKMKKDTFECIKAACERGRDYAYVGVTSQEVKIEDINIFHEELEVLGYEVEVINRSLIDDRFLKISWGKKNDEAEF